MLPQEAVRQSVRKRPLDFSRGGTYFAALLIVALVAFWPTYLSLGFGASSTFTHCHALTATLWMMLLIAQPVAIRRRHGFAMTGGGRNATSLARSSPAANEQYPAASIG